MATNSPRAMVLCSHPGRLLNYSVLLNRLEFYHLSLCLNLDEVRKALAAKQRYSLFIHDDFVPGASALMSLKALSQSNAFRQFVLVGNFSAEEKSGLFQWAWTHRVPLLEVLDKPISLAQLREVTGSMVLYQSEDECPIDASVREIRDYQVPGDRHCDSALR
ncbi:hypothetical protein NK553_13160 [Pseudomonas sp. ZM23]|uniref:Uncharacterized protein n=1 Tax=Pseudomonas triclosanedens TaxID=2961893 RepID=A0ABY7A5I3_9PSED|nr:hypothetical protein [Pseudomonas triclosanedens]MCP8464897.1 hypothetical protein [Pseudomonas triclosanedens]MCP8470391.1 hypothetical protein [Pseudomonas triclosanedens]MCP8476196.1 hypothetical protein [Pseudomonas triclosanedens]WAI51570.1 hypothetical protein OU419_10080 [Pseudomonas triclosanedens]